MFYYGDHASMRADDLDDSYDDDLSELDDGELRDLVRELRDLVRELRAQVEQLKAREQSRAATVAHAPGAFDGRSMADAMATTLKELKL